MTVSTVSHTFHVTDLLVGAIGLGLRTSSSSSACDHWLDSEYNDAVRGGGRAVEPGCLLGLQERPKACEDDVTDARESSCSTLGAADDLYSRSVAVSSLVSIADRLRFLFPICMCMSIAVHQWQTTRDFSSDFE